MSTISKMKKEIEWLNNVTYLDYYNRLKLLSLSMFEWQGLPDTVDVRFLEKILYQHGKAVFFYDSNLGYIITRVNQSGQLNIYDNPISVRAYATNYEKELKLSECVLIRNNYLDESTDTTISLYARKLYEVDRAIDINTKLQKFPALIKCNETQRQTMLNLFAQYDGNNPFIFGDKNLDIDSIKVFPLNTPFVALNLMEYKRQIWNECLTFLGINNANTSKRERLITNEVDSNNEQIDMSAEVMLLTRRQACEQINEMYGLNVSVKSRTEKEGENIE